MLRLRESNTTSYSPYYPSMSHINPMSHCCIHYHHGFRGALDGHLSIPITEAGYFAIDASVFDPLITYKGVCYVFPTSEHSLSSSPFSTATRDQRIAYPRLVSTDSDSFLYLCQVVFRYLPTELYNIIMRYVDFDALFMRWIYESNESGLDRSEKLISLWDLYLFFASHGLLMPTTQIYYITELKEVGFVRVSDHFDLSNPLQQFCFRPCPMTMDHFERRARDRLEVYNLRLCRGEEPFDRMAVNKHAACKPCPLIVDSRQMELTTMYPYEVYFHRQMNPFTMVDPRHFGSLRALKIPCGFLLTTELLHGKISSLKELRLKPSCYRNGRLPWHFFDSNLGQPMMCVFDAEDLMSEESEDEIVEEGDAPIVHEDDL